ncbi:MAG TPA: Clp protease N-terminal domain-containing protein, partial [Segetibacter sp.]|nr:Clp protease N-terminal domain-containing protein [Segetibacter sp.]
MNLNNYTIKGQEIIQQAQQIAFNNGNPNIETNHLLKALLDDENSPVEFLLKKNNINVAFLKTKIEE